MMNFSSKNGIKDDYSPVKLCRNCIELIQQLGHAGKVMTVFAVIAMIFWIIYGLIFGHNKSSTYESNTSYSASPNRGKFFPMAGKYAPSKDTIEKLNKAIRLDPNNTVLYNNRAVTKHLDGDYEGAIEDYTKVIKLNPYDADAYIDRGMAKHDFGDYKGGMEDFSKAIELSPNSAKLYTCRAYAKSMYGDYNGAIEDYEKVLELDPFDPYVRDVIKEVKQKR